MKGECIWNGYVGGTEYQIREQKVVDDIHYRYVLYEERYPNEFEEIFYGEYEDCKRLYNRIWNEAYMMKF